MKTHIQRYTAYWVLLMMIFQIFPIGMVSASSKEELMYPLKEISKLECRFEDFDTLSSSCKQLLPILRSEDYKKYAKQNGWYNDFTRIYTVLWGSSYKYGWDVWNGGHQGTDFATAKGTPVYSIADGTVIESETAVGWGKYVSIEHTINGQKIVSNYAHLSQLNVKKWEKVDIGDKIGEVGSTGNSTGNHLHFQIDLPSEFHPYYYDYAKCPYSYYQITEKGVCFDELAKNTFDPLIFLETGWAILDEVQVVQEEKVTTSSSKNNSTNSESYDDDIFNTTVYLEIGTRSDVKNVQEIMKDLGYYKGSITGDYEDVVESVTDFQIARWVIATKTDDGAGWFWPKTRKQVKNDYDSYLATGKKSTFTKATVQTTKTVVKTTQKVEKIEKAELLTREEIEAREINEFLSDYTITFDNPIGFVEKGGSNITNMKVENKRGRGFKWNTPGDVSFVYDETKLDVFPKSFYSFTNGERKITITGKQTGSTKISIKIGDKIVKTFSVSVGEKWVSAVPTNAKIYTGKDTTLASSNRAIVLMKDTHGNKLVRTDYKGRYTIEANADVQFCIKRWTLSDIKAIYKRPCYEEEYTDDLSFEYSDTIAGLLIFDYKVLDQKNTTLTLKQSSGKTFTSHSVTVSAPKWLTASYPYYDDVVSTLKAWITDWVVQWYFFEERELTQRDAKRWLENTLKEQGKTDTLAKLQKEVGNDFSSIDRQEFLEMTHTYLGNGDMKQSEKNYRDLEENDETMVASLLWTDYQWKDRFWDNYFQPEKKISRWEAAYMLTQALETTGKWYIVKN